MANSSGYSIIFQKIDDYLKANGHNFVLIDTMRQDEEIMRFAEIVDQFEEQQESPVYSAT